MNYSRRKSKIRRKTTTSVSTTSEVGGGCNTNSENTLPKSRKVSYKVSRSNRGSIRWSGNAADSTAAATAAVSGVPKAATEIPIEECEDEVFEGEQDQPREQGRGEKDTLLRLQSGQVLRVVSVKKAVLTAELKNALATAGLLPLDDVSNRVIIRTNAKKSPRTPQTAIDNADAKSNENWKLDPKVLQAKLNGLDNIDDDNNDGEEALH